MNNTRCFISWWVNKIQTFSWRMIKEERKQRKFGILLVSLASIQILSYLFIDYALYRFMEWIRLNAAVEYKTWNGEKNIHTKFKNFKNAEITCVSNVFIFYVEYINIYFFKFNKIHFSE